MMKILSDARKVADCFSESKIPVYYAQAYEFSDHLGAILSDVCLQPGLRYETVVYPRVRRIATDHPTAATVGGILALLDRMDLTTLLEIRNRRKLSVFEHLVLLLKRVGVQCSKGLKGWIEDPINQALLLEIKGFSQKSLDYMRRLLGLQAVAVDRHLRLFAEISGLDDLDYPYLSRVFQVASQLLELGLADFDTSVWKFFSVKTHSEVKP